MNRFINHTTLAIALHYAEGIAAFPYHRTRMMRNELGGRPDVYRDVSNGLFIRNIRLLGTNFWPVIKAGQISTCPVNVDGRDHSGATVNAQRVHWPSIVHYATLSDLAQGFL